MRLLLTGGTGFLGASFLAASENVEVIALGQRRPPQFAGEWIQGNLAHPLQLDRLPTRIDAVVHLAQSNQYRDFPGGAPDMFAVNVASTAQMLDWAVKAGARAFLYASTGNVYGARNGLAQETDAPDVRGDYYGASKLAAECLVDGFSRQLATCSLRLYGLYGPAQPRDKMLSNLIERVRSGEPITLQGDGEGYVTQPTYVADAVAVIHRALADGWTGSINVAGPEAASIMRLGELIGQALGRAPSFRRLPDAPPRPRLPDLGRLRSLGPDLPFTALPEGIARTVAATAESGDWAL